MRKLGKLLFGAALAAGMLASTPALAAGPVVTPGQDTSPPPTLKAAVKFRNFYNNNGFDVIIGPQGFPTGSVNYDSGSAMPWDASNAVTFSYDGGGTITTTFPTLNGGGGGTRSYVIGDLSPSNYLRVQIYCRHSYTDPTTGNVTPMNVKLTNVSLNGIPLPDFVPPVCGTGTVGAFWKVTGVDFASAFTLAATIQMDRPPVLLGGQETSKVEFNVGYLYVPTLMETKQDVMADLQDILNAVPPPVKAVADLIKTGIEHLGHSLRPQYWMPDGNAVTNKDGARVFDEEKKSVDALRKAPYDLVGFAITTLVAVDRKLAEDKIAAANPDHDYYAKAVNELAKGDADRDAGYPVNAINHYKKAWEHARKAGG